MLVETGGLGGSPQCCGDQPSHSAQQEGKSVTLFQDVGWDQWVLEVTRLPFAVPWFHRLMAPFQARSLNESAVLLRVVPFKAELPP